MENDTVARRVQHRGTGGPGAIRAALALLLAAALAPAAATADPVRDAIDICTTAATMTEARDRLAAVGFSLVSAADADTHFALSVGPRLNQSAASDAIGGLSAPEAARLRDLYARESGKRALLVQLAALSAEAYPEMVGPEARTYVKVSEALVFTRAEIAVTCELTAPASDTLDALHARLAVGDTGGDTGGFGGGFGGGFAADRIEVRADLQATRQGGAALSRRHLPAPFEALFGAAPAFAYQITIIASPVRG